MHKITVAIPTYNQAASGYLSEAIHSIRKQTYEDIQIIIYDDQSTDNTEDIVNSISHIDSRVVYSKNAKRLGLIRNFNHCLNCCETEYIVIFHDDDIMNPTMIERELREMVANPDCIIIGEQSATWIIDENGDTIRRSLFRKRRSFAKNEYIVDSVKKATPLISCPSVMFRKSLIDMYKLRFDEAAGYAADWHFWLNANTNDGKIILLGVTPFTPPIIKRREHKNEASILTTKTGGWNSGHAFIENFIHNTNASISCDNLERTFIKVYLSSFSSYIIENVTTPTLVIDHILESITNECQKYHWKLLPLDSIFLIILGNIIHAIGNDKLKISAYLSFYNCIRTKYNYKSNIISELKLWIKYYICLRNKT